MKKLLIFAVVIAAFNACITVNTIFPSGNIISETRYVNYFENISVSGGIQLIAYNGPQDVVVETHDNLMEYVETYVRNNTLVIKRSNNISFGGSARIKVYVSAELISSIDASGGSKVSVPELITSHKLSLNGSGGAKFECEGGAGKIECSELSVDISGGGKAELYIDCARLYAESSGGGKLEFEGYADIVDIHMSGGGNMYAFYLEMVELYAKMSGGATAEVNVSDYISGNLSGGAKIKYRGYPRLDVKTSGGSKVIAVE